LVEYKIDEDDAFEKDYIKGKYGAIPYLGNLSRLINHAYRDRSPSGLSEPLMSGFRFCS
jgi:uncharacterized protein